MARNLQVNRRGDEWNVDDAGTYFVNLRQQSMITPKPQSQMLRHSFGHVGLRIRISKTVVHEQGVPPTERRNTGSQQT